MYGRVNQMCIRDRLNIGMSGVGNWTHCMGGFEQYSPYDTELYTRWVQFGMFSVSYTHLIDYGG